MDDLTLALWTLEPAELLKRLQATPQGLSAADARERLARYGPNVLRPRPRTATLTLLLSQFTSPMILIFLVAASLSFFLQDPIDAAIILAIVLASGLLSFWQERGAAGAVAKLLVLVRARANTLRDGKSQELPVDEVVPGDVVLLSAGASIPADCRILESTDLFVDEAMLTGETYPVEKAAATLSAETPLARRTNVLFAGTHVVSGTAKALVVLAGSATEFGKIAEHLRLRPPETEFERGVRGFGYFLAEVTLILVIAIFAVNVYLQKPVLSSFLFSLALAIGLTPQLLPAIISVNLAHGARRMARVKVIVKRLAAIENLGAMDVLCSDKTGTLTDGVVRLQAALDANGNESEKVLLYAYLNARYETGFRNPIDEAIRANCKLDLASYRKVDEVPYDFIRKRLSVLVATPPANSGDGPRLMVTKGALANVLAVCSWAESPAGRRVQLATARTEIERRYGELSAQGFRTLGVAYKELPPEVLIDKDDEVEMTFLGFLVLADSPKPGIAQTVGDLKGLGVSLKIITGDNRLVAASVGGHLGLANPGVLAGPDLQKMSDEALLRQVDAVDLFAEIEPNQKERVLLALRKAGHVVGYIGDGINDASALHAADVGLSVESAVDVAKEAADFVLLEKDLGVLVQGVREGRATFANTLKYVFMATSANFGNMFSMAGASLFLPFLPLLPKQIMLTNLLTDFPELTIATDRVDADWIERPRRWNIEFIRRFMVTFGLVSSVFDYLTFGVLLWILHAGPAEFRTGWFVESVVSATLIVLVVRTRGSFFRSRPSRALLLATLVVAAATIAIPYTPGTLFGFVPLPPLFLAMIGLIVLAYVASVELAKRWFYRSGLG